MSKKLDIKGAAMRAVTIGGATVGAMKLSDKLPASLSAKVKGILFFVSGALGPAFLGKKSAIVENIGDGAIAAGSIILADAFAAPVSGIGYYTDPAHYDTVAGVQYQDPFTI